MAKSLSIVDPALIPKIQELKLRSGFLIFLPFYFDIEEVLHACIEFLEICQASTKISAIARCPRYNQSPVCTPVRLAFGHSCLRHIRESVGIINNSTPDTFDQESSLKVREEREKTICIENGIDV